MVRRVNFSCVVLSVAINAMFVAAFALPYSSDKKEEKLAVTVSLLSKPQQMVEKQSELQRKNVKSVNKLSEFSQKKLSVIDQEDQDAMYIPPQFKYGSIDNPIPKYPRIAINKRQEGRVLLCVDVDVNGSPSNVNICGSSGFTILDSAALKAVKKWRFIAGKLGKDLVASQVKVPIVFSLS